MADKKQKKPFCRAIVVGEIVDKKTDYTTEYTRDDGSKIPSKPYLEFSVKVSDTSRVRCRIMNSDSQPTRVTDLDRYLKDGDYVKVSGQIDYRKDKRDASKVYITVRPYTVDKVDASGNEAKANFVIQGEVRAKESDVVDGRPVLHFSLIISNEWKGNVFESEYPVVVYDDLAGDLFTQIDDGFEILVVGHIVQQLLRDEYDFVIGNVTELEVKGLREVISEDSDVPF